MRRPEDNSTEMPGQDSFLDVVANIVGILILLVMVIGVRASYVVDPIKAAEAPQENQQPVGENDVRAAQLTAADKERELGELLQNARDLREQRLLREQERGMLVTYVAAGQREVSSRRAELDKQQQEDFDLRRQLIDTQRELDDLTREQVSLLSQEPDVEVLESLPTPLAKTVTGDEVHLRLANGLVAVVPFEELRDELEAHQDRNLWRLRSQNSMEGTVGPINGFRLRYHLQLTQVAVPSRSGFDQMHVVPQFHVEFLPVSPQIGEPVDQAVLPNSDLLRTLKRYTPRSTTVTIWTYPDSFGDFRRLKKMLFDLGFASAGRPLPEGEPIGASPSGSKSAAQ